MPRTQTFILTENAIFLTIDQYARVADLNRSTAGDQLRFFERHRLLHFFGNTSLPGGKTPKELYSDYE